MKTIYLATAYSDRTPFGKFIMWLRNRRVTKVTAKIMMKGYNVFSPITHSHYVATIGDLPPLDHEFWLKLDEWYVDRCDEIWVYNQPGWMESVGVNREMDWAWEQGKPVCLVDKEGNILEYFTSRADLYWKMKANY
jgi:hypothetical protein